MPTIRPATREDGPTVARIYVESSNAGFRNLMPTAVLDEGRITRWSNTLAQGNWWVAEVDTTIAGFTGICPSRDPVDPHLGELDTIAVDPAYWRTGVGTALMRKALEEVAAGYPDAILWTLANYPQGQGFYVSTGWRPDGGTRDGGHQVSYRQRF